MRRSAITAANAIAWAVIVGLTGLACGMVVYLGPCGLTLLGVVMLFICTSLTLRDDTPIAGTEVFKARVASGPRSPEQKAASYADRHALLSSLRFYRWCRVVLVVAGAAGFAWQLWQ